MKQKYGEKEVALAVQARDKHLTASKQIFDEKVKQKRVIVDTILSTGAACLLRRTTRAVAVQST